MGFSGRRCYLHRQADSLSRGPVRYSEMGWRGSEKRERSGATVSLGVHMYSKPALDVWFAIACAYVHVCGFIPMGGLIAPALLLCVDVSASFLRMGFRFVIEFKHPQYGHCHDRGVYIIMNYSITFLSHYASAGGWMAALNVHLLNGLSLYW